MEIITDQSEKYLSDILPSLETAPQLWMSVHINLMPVRDLLLKDEGLSSNSINKINEINIDLANRINELGLNEFDGKILIFEDTDILALLLKTESNGHVLEKITSEFSKNGLGHLLKIEDMKEKLANLIVFSEEKKLTAMHYRMKQMAIKMGDNVKVLAPDPVIIEAIQNKRRIREASCVLIIEDDLLMSGLLVNMLKNMHNVVQARSGFSGIVSYVEHAPNTVLLDINMPGLSGHETLKRIKLIDPESHVIMLSGASTESNVISSHYNGAAGFLRKPFSKEKLYEYIDKHLSSS